MPFESAPEIETCSTCRRPLTRRGPSGECLRCLFITGLPSMDDELPVEGGHRYGHFEVVRAADGYLEVLGRGAMGTTYRARDTVLGSAVALKVIARRLANQPETRTRFLREAKAAARLRHPNVASVFHYGEEAGECFYAMELVEGETLEAWVRRKGPLPPAYALEVAVQVSHALVAAEAQGIVHRDLKPANLMLKAADADTHVPGGPMPQVKIIDFGLAKAVAADSLSAGDTRESGFVGTPAFASPEQFAADGGDIRSARVDTRTDIYALGVTLWFLLCGRTPFEGETLDEIHARQTRHPLPVAQLHAARVPAPLGVLLRNMLAVQPAERPGSARELLEKLHRVHLQVANAARVRLTRLVVALGSLALIVLTAALWREHTRPPPPPPDRSLAVLPFENLSPDPADAFFTTGIQDQITADLGRVATLRVTGSDSARHYPPRPPGRDLATVGRELGVRYLIEGSAKRTGGHLEVAVCLTDLRDPGYPWNQRYERRLTDVFAVQGEITRAVAEQLRATLSAEEKAAINRPPTTDLAAYDLYLHATDLARNNANGTVDALIQAAQQEVPLLEQAAARDPAFTLAYCELARAHDEIQYCRYTTSPSGGEEFMVDHRALAEAALAKARRLQPEVGEVHLAHALHALKINNDIEQAQEEINQAHRVLPNNAPVEILGGRIARRQGRWEEAVRAFQHVATLEPRNREGWDVLAQTLFQLRRYDEYERASSALIALIPSGEAHSWKFNQSMMAAVRRADLGPWRAEFAAQLAAGKLQDDDREYNPALLAYYDHDAAALTRALAAKRNPGYYNMGIIMPRAWYEAMAARMKGDDTTAQEAFAAARPQFETQVLANPTRGKSLSFLAIVDAGLGHRDEAVREGKLACEVSSYERMRFEAPIVRCNLAVVYAWTNQPDLAFAELEPLVGQPSGDFSLQQPSYGDFQLNPLWDPLRADPRFAALVQKLAPSAK